MKIPVLLLLLSFRAMCSSLAEEGAIQPERYEKEVVVANCADPMQLEVTPDGRVFFIERAGAVKCFDPASGLTEILVHLKTSVEGDAGALALALDPKFAVNGWLYVYYMVGEGPPQMRLARYTWQGGALQDEKRLLEIPLEQNTTVYHCGGGLGWDREGNLLLSTGDNSAPQDVPAVHPQDRTRDSRRSAGNSMDLRGKILRLTPQADGHYACPPGNLFADATQGRPEVYAMGVRNPFRVSCDPETGLITWGDVGGNVNVDYGLGPEGSDEINVTLQPGFFGWPWLSGVRGVWRSFDPANNQPVGDFFDPEHIVNDSPVNTGLKVLPPAKPPVLYYSNVVSKEWPFTGSGGRSVTGGVFYRTKSTDARRLPDGLQGSLVFGDWMRNWLGIAQVTPEGKLVSAGPFPGNLTFKRPSDFKIGPEGALYVAEYGEKWTGNTNGQITRVIYRRGNRPPAISLTADRTTGRVPLAVVVKAGISDPDLPSDQLTLRWELPEGLTPPPGKEGTITFPANGLWPVRAVVTDAAGLSRSASLTIAAGNEAPVVRFTEPRDGGFFEYGKPLAWQVSATDAEDGVLPAESVRVELSRRDTSPLGAAAGSAPGLELMRSTTCFACHQAAVKSAGPAYVEVARRYAQDAGAPARLALKIRSGGSGVWGEMPMPPHPQHTAAECASMVDWILSLAQTESASLPPGLSGTAQAPVPKNEWGRPQNGVLLLTATATDHGAGPMAALSSVPATVQLRTRRQRAYFFDAGEKALRQDNLDQGGMVARIPAGGEISFRQIDLSQCSGLTLEAWPQGSGKVTMEVRNGKGTVLGQAEADPGPGNGRPTLVRLPFTERQADHAPVDLSIHVLGDPGALLDVIWVDFLPR